jgi:S1-C subfamily serine protease
MNPWIRRAAYLWVTRKTGIMGVAWVLAALCVWWAVWPDVKPTPERIAERLRGSTVKIQGEFDEGNLMHDAESWEGSGVIWSHENGVYWIVSNCHVMGFWAIYKYDFINPAKINRYKLSVTMPDGRQAEAKRILINSYLKDFALIAIDDSIGSYPELRKCQFHPKQGQKVFAMGHPRGLSYSFSSGVISGFREYKSDRNATYTLVQTDASINHGNSGGPLVDDYGKLVGLNTLGMSDAVGLNFAIAIGEIYTSIQKEEFVDFPLSPSEIGPFVRKLKQPQ